MTQYRLIGIEDPPRPPRYHLVGRRTCRSRAEVMAEDSCLGHMIRQARLLIERNKWFAAVVNQLDADGQVTAVYADADVGGPEQNILTGGDIRARDGERVVC